MTSQLVVLALVWLLWCFGHSLLATSMVKQWFLCRSRLSESAYRLCYNVVALLSVSPIVLWSFSLGGDELLVWRGPLRLLQAVLLVTGGWLAWAGCRVYSLREFLGVETCRRESVSSPELVTSGVLAWVRHPWYLAGLLLLWGRDLDAAQLVTATILSGYLLTGSRLEERRLHEQFGAAYEAYCCRVSAFIPWQRLIELLENAWRRRPG